MTSRATRDGRFGLVIQRRREHFSVPDAPPANAPAPPDLSARGVSMRSADDLRDDQEYLIVARARTPTGCSPANRSAIAGARLAGLAYLAAARPAHRTGRPKRAVWAVRGYVG